MKTNFFERNGIAVFYALQVLFILLAIAEAYCHRWLGVVSNLVMVLAIAVFITHVRMSIRRKGTISMLMDLVVLIAHSKVQEQENKEDKQSTEEEVAAKQQMLDSLVGLTIVKTGHCDTCPNEKSDCKKLILADGSHICVKDMTKQPSKAQ
ncbi:MAG: hypothetical protein [Bacteriophage sp.]|nr:MAG: hypothetical protein [Bacteriophage sp.]